LPASMCAAMPMFRQRSSPMAFHGSYITPGEKKRGLIYFSHWLSFVFYSLRL
jgi:hypothetical protein